MRRPAQVRVNAVDRKTFPPGARSKSDHLQMSKLEVVARHVDRAGGALRLRGPPRSRVLIEGFQRWKTPAQIHAARSARHTQRDSARAVLQDDLAQTVIRDPEFTRLEQ